MNLAVNRGDAVEGMSPLPSAEEQTGVRLESGGNRPPLTAADLLLQPTDADDRLRPAVRKKLGKRLATQADETVRDVIRSRGGTASNVNEAKHWADRTLSEAAEAAVEGDESAETAVKIAKQAKRLGQH